MSNLEIAELLNNISASYKLKGKEKNRFRIIAYERAADAVEHLSSEAKDLYDENKLEDVAGIGVSIAKHIGDIFRTGTSKHFIKVMSDIPPATFELMKVSGIGPKTAFRFAAELGIKSLSDLNKAAKAKKIEGLAGFGKDSQEAIEKAIKEVKDRSTRLLLPYATEVARDVIEWIIKEDSVITSDVLGSLRRKVSTVGDIDVVCATKNPKAALDHFCNYPNATRVLEKGERSASIILPGNKQVDMIATKPESYGALLQHFTGSKHHNIALREHALKIGLSVSDYGIYIKKGDKKTLKEFENEEKFYKFLGMDWIPPELREGAGEIQAAIQGQLPNLVETKDIKADLHVHSDFDIETSHDTGASSMEDLINKASDLGYQYIAFTEHNPSKSKHSSKQRTELIKKKKIAIEQLNYSYKSKYIHRAIKVYNSLEIDILPDGSLPVSNEALDLLDFALVSIHSSFKQSKNVMTKRVLDGLSHPKVKVYAHPTARKLNEREGIELDWENIFDFCKKNNKWIEINASPSRLDLPSHLVKEAVKAGIMLTIGTDSHHKDHMDNMNWGVAVARRGWAEKSNIVNAASLNEFEDMLK